MLVFRENRVAVSTHLLVRTLTEKLKAIGTGRDALLDALLRAGELECGLADAGSRAASWAAELTDAVANLLVNGDGAIAPRSPSSIEHIDLPPTVKISPPEGFAYYALHPMKYADLVARLREVADNAAVLGIRSIGTTLGAVVGAALAGRGVLVERISARPTGHPFHREMRFTPGDLAWVQQQRDLGADFFVVDEGPGLSGSSFLSVGEALVRAGVERGRITFLCTHYPNTDLLRSYDAGARWSKFRACPVEHNAHVPAGAAVELGGGLWRQHVFASAPEWPGCWPQMERVKFFSTDHKLLSKFEGFGRFGQEVCERARLMARGGFGPEPRSREEGFATYPWIAGRRGNATELSAPLLDRLADYCAFRAGEFRSEGNPFAHSSDLAAMVRCNISEEFGVEPELDEAVLSGEGPVFADGRMHPHEWVQDAGGTWLKVDGGAHGDDHFYPGPCDIAWDLAGAIVEWHMDRDAMEYFLKRYGARSGDNPSLRLPAFLQAYTAFRLGYCKMAAEGVGDADERQRLTREYQLYRELLQSSLPQKSFTLQVSGL